MPKLKSSDISKDCLRTSDKKGFTLIEILVAITILAIVSSIGLATYSSAQIVARDDRRMADLRSVSTALELYYNSVTPKSYPVGSWLQLSAALPPNYIDQMPTPPTSSTAYQYYYASPAPGTSGPTFELCTPLENSNAVVGNGVDTNPSACGGSGPTKWFHIHNP